MRRKRANLEDDPDARLAMVLLRYIAGWNQSQLAEATGIAASQISDYDQGYQVIPRKHLERMADAVGFPRPLLDPLLQMLRFFRLAVQGRRRVERLLYLTVFWSRLLTLADAVADLITGDDAARRPQARALDPKERGAAEVLWERFSRRSPAEQQALVDEAPEFQTWALSERVARESIAVAGDDAREALRLASLAVRIAERVSGTPEWRSRVKGYALAHLGNAERVCGDLRTASATLARGRTLWDLGAPGDPGLLNGVWILWIEATLLHVQERPQEALLRIRDALVADQGELRPRLLYTKARCIEALGGIEESTALLREAASLVDLNRETRFALGVHIQLLVNLCAQGLAQEAELGLPHVRQLAERLGMKADTMRSLWIEGRVAAALGQTDDAKVHLGQVRQYFEEQEIAYDYAVVSLELALVLLRVGQRAEVRVLASDLLRIFRHLDLPENALAALRLFCEAANREDATMDFVKQLLTFLNRAQRDSSLVFTPES